MARDKQLSRRSVLRFGSGTVAAGLIAGCTDGGGEVEDDPETDDQLEEEADDADPPETGQDDDWEAVETIELEADAEDGWMGRRPDAIEGEENPDIILYEGTEYEFIWTNMDGDGHNLAIWDDTSPIVASSFVDDEDETVEFTVEATDEMEMYLCEVHSDDMVGSIEIRSE